jgi:hypothetical protein
MEFDNITHLKGMSLLHPSFTPYFLHLGKERSKTMKKGSKANSEQQQSVLLLYQPLSTSTI